MPDPPFPVDADALEVLRHLWQNGHAAYLVGGAVRDALQGRASHDWDVTTDARPERLLELFPKGAYENRFGTVRAGRVEITTFRREHRYADHRRPEVVAFSLEIEEDLARRDFTVNAICWGRAASMPPDAGAPPDAGVPPDVEAGFVDPWGGRADLTAGVLRAVGDPDARFEEDALRLLRAARLAATADLSIEPDTWRAMAAHAADLRWVSAERAGAEVRRMLDAPVPSVAFRVMADTGVLAALMPELAALRDRAGGDLLGPSLAVLDRAAAVAPGRERLLLCALLHGVGTESRTILLRLRFRAREAVEVARLLTVERPADPARLDDAAVRRVMRAAGPELVDDLLALWSVQDLASLGQAAEVDALRRRVEAQSEARVPLALADLAVDGDDLVGELGMVPGPPIGQLLERLLEEVIERPEANTRERLLAIARDPAAPVR